MSGERPDLLVLADDLSGAAECAAVFLHRDVDIALDIDRLQSEADVRVLDLGTRIMTAADAARRLREVLDGVPGDVQVVKKIDSMLRGNIAAELETLSETGPVVVAAALPALNRTTANGVLHIDGVPLHLSGRWGMERTAPPESIDDLLPGIATVSLGVGVTEDELRSALSSGAVAVCDASTDEDLDTVVAAAASVPGVRLVGTAALAAAVARTLPTRTVDMRNPEPAPALVVVGTAEAVAVEQVRYLERSGATHVQVDVDDLLNARTDPDTVRSALALGVAVLTVSGPVEPSRASSVASALGELVAAVVRGRSVGLVLTGGETARRVIDALGITTLEPVAEVHRGAVVSRTSDGTRIATRRGSFGDHDSLVSMSNHLRGIDDNVFFSHSEALA